MKIGKYESCIKIFDFELICLFLDAGVRWDDGNREPRTFYITIKCES